MYSFYGGRSGAPFILSGSFPSVAAMVEAFSQGGAYTEINYDEYVIIDAPNKQDPDNGKLYKRGYDYTNDMGGAIYIGQIVGPQGEVAEIEIDTVENIVNNHEGELKKGELNVIPGKDNETFNDKIQYAYVTIRDEFGNVTGSLIGFDFPYHVLEMTAQSVDAYFNRDSEEKDFVNRDLVSRIDDKQHPFYSQWQIHVPKGIKGDIVNSIDVDLETGKYYYTIKNFDRNAEGELLISTASGTEKFYVGDYRVIKDIKYDVSNSKLLITYTSFQKSEDGEFILGEDGQYINEFEYIEKPLRFIVDIEIDEMTQKFKVIYSDFDEEGNPQFELVGDPIKYIKDSYMDGETQKIKITYNTFHETLEGEVVDFTKDGVNYTYDYQLVGNPIKYLDNVQIDTGDVEGEGTQKVEVTYNTREKELIGNPLNYIMQTAISQDSCLLVLYSDPARRAAIVAAGENVTFTDSNGIKRSDWHNLGYIKGESGGIHIIGNYDSYEDLIAAYAEKDENGNSIYIGLETGIRYYYNTTTKRYEDESGNPIDQTDTSKYKVSSVGPTGDYYGWVCTVTGQSESIDGETLVYTYFYAYDYLDESRQWYYIGSISSSTIDPSASIIVCKALPSGNPEIGTLNEKGVWFVVETV